MDFRVAGVHGKWFPVARVSMSSIGTWYGDPPASLLPPSQCSEMDERLMLILGCLRVFNQEPSRL
jgi:hypothetical protein